MAAQPEDYPTPGRYIRALLDDRQWDQRTLARVLGLDYGTTNRIATDKKAIDGFAAIMLGEAFGVDPMVFLNLRTKYDLAVARAATVHDPKRAVRAAVYGQFPIAEMVKRRWLHVADFDDVAEVETAVARFFGVGTVAEIPNLPHAARKTEPNAPPTGIQTSWVNQLLRIGATLQVPRYSPTAVREALEKLESLLPRAEDVAKVGAIIAKCGIRLVIVEPLSNSKIDGATTWLNDMAPVIGLSLRHDRIDNFWFCLRHELEHVLRGHGRREPRVDFNLGGDRNGGLSEDEKAADDAAADFCVPHEAMETFYARKYPYFLKQDILGFAASQRRHPGLVIGQLQHKAGRFDRLREYLSKVRNLILPTVTADGWGRMSPIAESRAI